MLREYDILISSSSSINKNVELKRMKLLNYIFRVCLDYRYLKIFKDKNAYLSYYTMKERHWFKKIKLFNPNRL